MLVLYFKNEFTFINLFYKFTGYLPDQLATLYNYLPFPGQLQMHHKWCQRFYYDLLFTNTNLVSRLGRKKLIIFSGITAATMGLGRSITSSYWVYVVLELIEALFGDTYSATFMLG